MEALRRLLGLSQENFARRLGISTRTLQRWENGETEPSFTVAQFRVLEQCLVEKGWSLNVIPDSLRPGSPLRLNQEFAMVP